ncbi:MAG TPA: hypothetical protein VGF96_04940 [Terracidiphilus sp.]
MKTTIMARHVTLLLAFCAIQCVMTTSACAFQNAVIPSEVVHGVAANDDTASFAGTWNYGLPNYEKDINISRISCPKGKTPPDRTLFVPQVGSITMTKTGEHEMLGTTDQGCGWTFITDGNSAHLDGPQKSCFNKIIQVSYTVTKWDISLTKGAWDEFMTVDSTSSMGTCESVKAKGPRSRVIEDSKRDDAKTFVGNWRYEPTDPVTQKNTALAACPDSKMPQMLILKGSMSIEQTGPHSINAINENGCRLKFAVQGNTAALNPSVQTCENAPKGSPKTYNFWTMATDGKELFEFGSALIGDEHGDCVLRATQGVRSLQ